MIMKHRFTLLAAVSLTASVFAQDFTVDDIKYKVLEGTKTCQLTNGKEATGALEIPATVKYNGEDYSVIKIGEEAFMKDSLLTSVKIPSTVTEISSFAFRECKRLESASIGPNVSVIGGSAFYDCPQLTSIVIPEKVEVLNAATFNKCVSLASVEIKGTVKSLAYGVFQDCKSLTSVDFKEGLESIGYAAFSGCSSLKRLALPASVSSLGNSCFQGCTNLESIDVADGNAFYTAIDDVLYTADFSQLIKCAAKHSGEVVVKNGCKTILSQAFEYCEGLTSITLPSGLESIGYAAFDSCTGIKYMSIPEACLKIENYAFDNCSSLSTFYLPSKIETLSFGLLANCTSLTSIWIPNSVKNVMRQAFQNTGITEISLPAALESLDPAAFLECYVLENINIAEECAAYKSVDGVVYTADLSTVVTCPGGKKGDLILPEGLTEIGPLAYTNCQYIKNVTLPESIRTIGMSAFYYCI